MNGFAAILEQLAAREPTESKPRPAPPPPRPIAWGLEHIERRSDSRSDPSRGIWPRSYAVPKAEHADCAHCDGVGAIFVTPEGGAYPVSVDCVCADLARLVNSYNRIGLPDGFDHVTLKGTRWDFPPAQVARASVEAMIEGWVPRAPGLVLYGSNGSGKNHMAALICTKIGTRAPRDYGDGRGVRRPVVRSVDWPTLLQKVKAGFGSGESEASIIAPYLNADLLWIDEVGMGRQTDFTARVVEELLWRRLNSKQTTIITANLPLDAESAPKGWDRDASGRPVERPKGTLSSHLGARVMSRMQDQAFVLMAGADYRSWRNRP